MDVDEKLRKAGERWRSEQTSPREPDWARTTRRQAPPLGGGVGAALIGLAALSLVLGLAVFRSGHASNPGAVASTQPSGSPVPRLVNEGDAVTAVGIVIQPVAGATQLCRTNPQPTDGGQAPPTCSAIAVVIHGFDPSGIPSWTRRDRIGFSTALVVVRGTWRAQAIDVLTAAETSNGEQIQPVSLPCATPTGGWVVDEFSSGSARESALARLATMVAQSPDVYSGLWSAHPEGTTPSQPSVMVVGTVDGSSQVEASLRQVYPGNLCVDRVDFSATRLREVAARLQGVNPSWRVVVSPDHDRVKLSIVVLDDSAATSIGADPATIVDPLVVPD